MNNPRAIEYIENRTYDEIAVDLAHLLNIPEPKVAILAAVETVNPKMRATLDAAILCKMADRGQITGGLLDGPLAFDNAVSRAAPSAPPGTVSSNRRAPCIIGAHPVNPLETTMTTASYENVATTALPSSAPRILQRMLALDDFEDAARRRIPRPIFGYINGGVETDASLRDNRAVWDELQFIPKSLIDTSARSLKTTLFGTAYDLPFGIPPMGGTGMACPNGDVALARAAARANIPMVVSGAALTPLERIRQEGRTTWFQAYLPGEDDVIRQLVERVERAGYDTLVLTVDVAVLANRENNVRTGFSTPLRPSLRLVWDMGIRPRWGFSMLRHTLAHGMPHFENMGPRVPMISALNRQAGRRDKLSWAHVDLMRKLWKGRLLLKGILDPQDARRASDAGVDGIFVSNHGGRQLDGAASPLRVLPAVKAQAGNMAVMLDSGIRRGTDVLKALALGADFVFVGRPFLYAIAIAGEHGAQHAINLLRSELATDMALIGINTLAEMRPEMLLDRRAFDWQGAGVNK